MNLLHEEVRAVVWDVLCGSFGDGVLGGIKLPELGHAQCGATHEEHAQRAADEHCYRRTDDACRETDYEFTELWATGHEDHVDGGHSTTQLIGS